mgnify:CR=1 FL=1
MNLKGRHFLTLKDFTPEEILYLVDLAYDLKQKRKQGIKGESLKGKNIAHHDGGYSTWRVDMTDTLELMSSLWDDVKNYNVDEGGSNYDFFFGDGNC